MSASGRLWTIVLALVAFVVVTFGATAASGVVAALADSAGVVLPATMYLAAATALGLLASAHVMGVLD